MKRFILIALALHSVPAFALAAKSFSPDTGSSLTTSLSSYWSMEGNSNDAKGSVNGTDTNATYSSGNGKITQGVGFGGNGKIAFGDNFSFERTDSFSVSFWMKSTDTGDRALIGRGATVLAHTGKGWFIHQVNGLIYFTLNSGGSYQANEFQTSQSAVDVHDGSFHHVVVTYAGTSNEAGTKIYVDGTSRTLTTDANTLSATIVNAVNATIGAQSADANPWTGAIDEVGIWTKVLSATEVTDLYNSGSGNAYIERASARRLRGMGITR